MQSPFVPAEGVLTLRRDGIVKTERFTMNDSTTTLKIPLEENYLPNLHRRKLTSWVQVRAPMTNGES